jgi:hypothetical protein
VRHSDPGDAIFSLKIPHWSAIRFEAVAYFYAITHSQDISSILSLLWLSVNIMKIAP